MSDRLTAQEAEIIRRYLAHQFEWLVDEDGDCPSGSDVIDQLSSIYETLQEVAKVMPPFASTKPEVRSDGR